MSTDSTASDAAWGELAAMSPGLLAEALRYARAVIGTDQERQVAETVVDLLSRWDVDVNDPEAFISAFMELARNGSAHRLHH